MKQFNNKLLVMLTCMILGFVGTAKGQIYSSEALFYVEAGKSLMSNPTLQVVHVDNETNNVFISGLSHGMSAIEKNGFQKYDDYGYVRDCIRKGVTVYQCKYNPRLSKNGKEVYEYYSYGIFNSYFVFSDDKSTFERISPKGDKKTTYIRVDRDKIKTKESSDDYDFLYD